MKRLRIRTSTGTARPVPIGDDPVTIGRHPKNTIRLVDERLSREHCVVTRESEDAARVRDLDSRNGTKVNGLSVAEAVVREGDVITVGRTDLMIEAVTADPTPNGEGRSGDSGATAAQAPAKIKRRAQPEALSATDREWIEQLRSVLTGLPPKVESEPSVRVIDSRGQKSAVLEGSGPGPRACELMLQVSSKSRATDIHIEPKSDVSQVRMRVDGQMVWIVDLPRKVGDLFQGLIKAACLMTSAARDSVQEGHFSSRYPDRRVEYRASFTPSVNGQKLVLRVLDQRDAPQSLDELGLAPYMMKPVQRLCEQDSGLLLVCGPTGSGKTTTLYNALREVDRDAKNVVTIEDPVEYQLDGVTQMPVDEGRGNSFGTLLRSVLRQDPDVILVGEIRDEETARIAMQAAMTGHVVYSTVHSKDTISAVFRLLDLKVEPYLVANSLDVVLAQRLCRTLCPHCKREAPVTPGQASRLGKYLGGKTVQMTPVGCKRCLGTGFRGRQALFELLEFNDELRDVVLSEPSIAAMKKVIEGGLFTTLVQSGWRMVADGTTSLEEVDRVAGRA